MPSKAPFSSPFAIATEAAACAHASRSVVSFSRLVGSLSKRRYPALYSVVLPVRQKGEDNKIGWLRLTLS